MERKLTWRSGSTSIANYFETNDKSGNRLSNSSKWGRKLYAAYSDILKPSDIICQLQFSEDSENFSQKNRFPPTALNCEHSQVKRIFFTFNFICTWESCMFRLSLFSNELYFPIESLSNATLNIVFIEV